MLNSRPVALAMDSNVFPSKTPGRMKTRTENAVPMTVHAKGKEIMIQTPFHGGKQAYQKAPTVQLQGKQTVSRPTRILGDKTPFPNRSNIQKLETPASQLLKLPVLSFLEPQSQLDKTPDSLRRPSSARTQDRVPRNANKLFMTPINNGNHWDVSPLSVSSPEVEAQESQPPEDDFDEIECMPPNTLHLAFEPAVDIELPDYKEVGKALFELAHTCPIDNTPVTEIEINEKDIQLPGWDLLPVTELESDDPFRRGSEPKSTTARTRTKTTFSTRQIAPPANKTIHRPPTQAPLPKSVPLLRSELPVSTINPKKGSLSLRPTPSLPRNASINSVVPNISRTNSVKPNPSVDKAKATAASQPVKLASKPSQSVLSRLATPTAARSRPTSAASTTVRRPMTSASHKAPPVTRKASPSGDVKKDEGRSMDAFSLVVETGGDLCEDFRFDV